MQQNIKWFGQTPKSLPESGIVLQSLPPLSLYIHLPWCVQKCPYCDFNSHATAQIARQSSNLGLNFVQQTVSQTGMQVLPKSLEDDYLQALAWDIEQTLPLIWGRPIHSVFIGGGTPSLFSADAIDALMAMLRSLLPMHYCQEVTLEANPSSFEVEKFKAYSQSGITRLSIGVQSFNDSALQKLGRAHNAKQAIKAIETAKKYFKYVNTDIMYALPEQTLQEAKQDLLQALSFELDHASYYQLTLEPNTLFAKHPPNLPHEDIQFDMQIQGIELLAAHDLNRYEISAYAKKNSMAKHNLNYWQFGDYIGIGAGAHGKISFPNKIIRTVKHKHPFKYLEQAKTKQSLLQEERYLNISELPFELALNAFRLIDGIDYDTVYAHTGLQKQNLEPNLSLAIKKQLLKENTTHLCATPLGLDFLNDLQSMFL